MQGIQGPKGRDGREFHAMVGNTTTLPPGSDATVTINEDEELDIVYYNFGIPQGIKGDTGDTNLVSFEIENGMLKAYDEEGNIYNLGMVAMEPMGEYDDETSYDRLNTVLYNDSTYMALKPSLGNLPTNTEYWQLIGGGVTKEYVEQQTVDNLDSTSTTRPLSANQGNNLNKNKIEVFDTVALMKTANLKNNMTVETLGYYEANDGGAATYKITDEESQEKYQEELENGLYAELIIHNETYIPEQFGAKSDGTGDCSSILQNIFDKVKDNGKILLTGTYLIEQPLYIPNKNNIVISGGTLKASNTFSGYILNSNLTATTKYSGWSFKTENITLENVFIDGSYKANGIYLDSYLRVKIISCTIHNFKDYGIYLNSGHEAEIICTNIIGQTHGDVEYGNTGILINSHDNIVDSCVIAYCQWAIEVKNSCNQVCNSHFYCNNGNDSGNIKISETSFVSFDNNYFDGSGLYVINPWNIIIDNNIFLVSDNTKHIIKLSKTTVGNPTVKGFYITNSVIKDNRTDQTTVYNFISCDFTAQLTQDCFIENIQSPDSININNPSNIFAFRNNSIPVIIPDSFFRASNSNHTIGAHFETTNFYEYSYNANYLKTNYIGSTSTYPWLFVKIFIPEKMKISKDVLDNTSFDMDIFDSSENYIGSNKVTLEKGFYYIGIYRTHEFIISNN